MLAVWTSQSTRQNLILEMDRTVRTDQMVDCPTEDDRTTRTANQNTNVDVAGQLPSAKASPLRQRKGPWQKTIRQWRLPARLADFSM